MYNGEGRPKKEYGVTVDRYIVQYGVCGGKHMHSGETQSNTWPDRNMLCIAKSFPSRQLHTKTVYFLGALTPVSVLMLRCLHVKSLPPKLSLPDGENLWNLTRQSKQASKQELTGFSPQSWVHVLRRKLVSLPPSGCDSSSSGDESPARVVSGWEDMPLEEKEGILCVFITKAWALPWSQSGKRFRSVCKSCVQGVAWVT